MWSQCGRGELLDPVMSEPHAAALLLLLPVVAIPARTAIFAACCGRYSGHNDLCRPVGGAAGRAMAVQESWQLQASEIPGDA